MCSHCLWRNNMILLGVVLLASQQLEHFFFLSTTDAFQPRPNNNIYNKASTKASFGTKFHPASAPWYSGELGVNTISRGHRHRLFSTAASTLSENKNELAVTPQVFAAGHSTNSDIVEALQEATSMALAALPQASTPNAPSANIDLAVVSVSSLYDGGAKSPTLVVVDTVAKTITSQGRTLQNLIGSSVGGCISSQAKIVPDTSTDNDDDETIASACTPIETQGVPSVSVTLALLPGCQVRTFHVEDPDLPDDLGRCPPNTWKRAVGLGGWGGDSNEMPNPTSKDDSVFMLLPSPAFINSLDDLLQGLSMYFPGSQAIGGVASTVSSLSRARLFQFKRGQSSTYSDGCLGVALAGDIKVKTLTARGAKAVGGIYQILKGQDSTIQVIVLDELATEQLEQEEEDALEEIEEDDDDDDETDARTQQMNEYAKARIPKPVLAEANFLMRSLSDDDQAFMRKKLLVGLEQGGSLGRTASELARLAQGQGHRFTICEVASASMKDGSVTMPLESVEIAPGTRMRFFVRDSEYAKREVKAVWVGYKKQLLSEQFQRQSGDNEGTSSSFTPTACFMVPTLDRGNKFFLGKEGFESDSVANILPTLPCISGFFSNGVIGPVDDAEGTKTSVQGSASGYFLIGSKTDRPIYSPANAAAEQDSLKKESDSAETGEETLASENDEGLLRTTKSSVDLKSNARAPRSEDGELIIKRREVHSGRALKVSTVEWSVAENTAIPTSALEGFMWDKETEVDRFRERVPLANLVSQYSLSKTDPNSPKPRDLVGSLKQASQNDQLVIIPECKRTEPATGSLRKRYDVSKLARSFTLAGASVLSVNCDGILFGGSLDDVAKARTAASAAAVEAMSEDGVIAPRILASDLILYPYQLYKLRTAGADAVNLVGGSLANKDMTYLAKIASALQLQVLVTITSEVQLDALTALTPGSIDGVILSNRELEDFTFDMTGEQALNLLKSKSLAEVKSKHGGDDLPVLIEGRVGIIERPNDRGELSAMQYLEELKQAGAMAAVVGGGLVEEGSEILQLLETQP